MLVYISFNMFDYTQTLVVFKDTEEVTRCSTTFDALPQKIVDICYEFNAFEVKMDYVDFISGLAKQVAIVEASKYSKNKIKFI